jgi:hypothetical protein
VPAWEKTLDAFIECLRSGRFEPGLRVKRVQWSLADGIGVRLSALIPSSVA